MEFSYDTLKIRLRELAFLNKGPAHLPRSTSAPNQKNDYCFEGGIVQFVKVLKQKQGAAASRADLLHDRKGHGQRRDRDAVQRFSYNENIYSYANNIPTHEGGTHLMGFKSG